MGVGNLRLGPGFAFDYVMLGNFFVPLSLNFLMCQINAWEKTGISEDGTGLVSTSDFFRKLSKYKEGGTGPALDC